LLWLSRRRDAEAERERIARDSESRTTALEAHLAELRAVERALEEVRSAHYAASDAVHDAQGGLLQVNSEVSRLESEIRMIVDSRTRLATHIDALRASRQRRLQEHDELGARSTELTELIEDTRRRLAEAGDACS
jgi:chromosome segregation protein